MAAKKPASKSAKPSSKKTASKSSSTKKPVAKKTTSTTKKPVSQAKKTAPKTTTKKSVVAKKTSAKPAAKKSLEKKSTSQTKKQVVAKKTKTKKVVIESYSCIRRYYSIVDSKTNEQKTKRMWIVIGDGHKRYRKFETQAEAIHYFRSLKKHAKMRVQSVNSKQFIKVVYTLIEMERKGIDISIIKKAKKAPTKKDIINETQDYEDEFSQFDEATSELELEFDSSEIDKVISEGEGITFVSEEEPIEEELKTLDVEVKEPQSTIIVNEEQNNDPYALTHEYTMEASIIEDAKEENSSLYEIAKQDNVVLNTPIKEEVISETVMNDSNNDVELTMNNTSTNTLLNKVPEENTAIVAQESKGKTVLYWTIVVLIALLLAAAVSFAIFQALTK